MSAQALTFKEGAFAVALIVATVVGYVWVKGQPSPPVAPPVANPAPAPARPAPCVLSLRGTQQGPVVFPTEEGASEFDNVLTTRTNDTELVNAVLRANGGMITAWRTPCSMISEGFSHSKIRVLGGPFAGQVGYVPTSQTRGH